MKKYKETLVNGLKFAVREFQLITVILLFLMGVMGFISYLNYGPETTYFDWIFPFQVLGVSIPTSLCSFVFVSRHELSKREFLTRCVIHLILLLIIVFGEGFLFKWWREPSGMITVGIIFIIIYVSVWVITTLVDKKSSDNINKALHNVKIKEDREKE
jgi:hypothetical protein